MGDGYDIWFLKGYGTLHAFSTVHGIPFQCLKTGKRLCSHEVSVRFSVGDSLSVLYHTDHFLGREEHHLDRIIGRPLGGLPEWLGPDLQGTRPSAGGSDSFSRRGAESFLLLFSSLRTSASPREFSSPLSRAEAQRRRELLPSVLFSPRLSVSARAFFSLLFEAIDSSDDAFFRQRSPEVEDVAEFEISEAQIGLNLLAVRPADLCNRLEFDDDFVRYHQIRAKGLIK